MRLLDRLRPHPKWQHQDAAIRAAAVQTLDADDQELLGAIARDDTDARVRRTAVRKLSDPATLVAVALHDADESVRQEAAALLLALAVQGTGEAASEAALAGLIEPRHLVAVAKTAVFESIRRAALSRVTDEKALGAIARQAEHGPTRLEALARMADPAELGAVALKSDHKDVVLAALERIDDPETLQAIATRARTKVAARRAKALGRARLPAPEPSAADPDRLERRQLCERLESLATSPDWGQIAARITEAESRWNALGLDDENALAPRFRAAAETLRQRLTRHAADIAEHERLARERAQVIEARTALCEAVESLDGPDALDRLREVRARWDPRARIAGPDLSALEERFDRGCRDCERRHHRWTAARARRARLEPILEELEKLAEAAQFPAANGPWSALQQEWTGLAATAEAEADLLTRFRQAEARLEARAAEAQEAQTRRQQVILSRIQELCAQLEARIGTPGLSLKEVESALRGVKAATLDLARLPTKRDQEEISSRLRALQAALFPKVQELRDIDEWQRWANAGVQEELCGRLDALRASDDLEKAARRLREIEREWQKVAAAPRDRGEALWRRFKAARDNVRARCEAYVARQVEEQRANFTSKEALCGRVEALATSTAWVSAAEQIKALQAEWKTVGPVPRHQEKPIWERFRRACDRFFSARQADRDRRKAEWAQNLARKQAMCARIEALADSADWDTDVAEVTRLQMDWKAVGPVRKNRSEALWERFRAARDRFFERYAQRDALALAANLARREGLCRELEELLPPADSPTLPTPPADLATRVQATWRGWQQAGAAPRDQAEALHNRFAVAFARVIEIYSESIRGTSLDPDVNRRNMEKLCDRVETLLAAHVGLGVGGVSPAERLARQLRETLAATTIGGKIDETAKWTAAVDEVRAAQAAWRRLGPVPEAIKQPLSDRFDTACRRFFDRIRRAQRT